MELYTSKTLTDEEGPAADTAKLVMIYASKEEVLKLCAFFAKVEKRLNEKNKCHLHFRDSLKDWDRNKHIDIEINVD